ncbi:hypothetical protein ACA910_020363 [Epithemia clementina (nom. ined.)]
MFSRPATTITTRGKDTAIHSTHNLEPTNKMEFSMANASFPPNKLGSFRWQCAALCMLLLFSCCPFAIASSSVSVSNTDELEEENEVVFTYMTSYCRKNQWELRNVQVACYNNGDPLDAAATSTAAVCRTGRYSAIVGRVDGAQGVAQWRVCPASATVPTIVGLLPMRGRVRINTTIPPSMFAAHWPISKCNQTKTKGKTEDWVVVFDDDERFPVWPLEPKGYTWQTHMLFFLLFLATA